MEDIGSLIEEPVAEATATPTHQADEVYPAAAAVSASAKLPETKPGATLVPADPRKSAPLCLTTAQDEGSKPLFQVPQKDESWKPATSHKDEGSVTARSNNTTHDAVMVPKLPLSGPLESCVESPFNEEERVNDGVGAFITEVPEKAQLLWDIADFHAFREAASTSQLPPLVSPQFGGGCQIRLWPYVREHIKGCVDIPATKWRRAGLARFDIEVRRLDGKAIIHRKVDIRVERGSYDSHSATFFLTREKHIPAKYFPTRVNHLLRGSALHLCVKMKYFPDDAPIFKATAAALAEPTKRTLLTDIHAFCRDDPSQNIELRCVGRTFQSCKFLLQARSKKFRELIREAPHTNAITVKDVSPLVLEQMLAYVAADECDWVNESLTTEEDSPSLENSLALFQAADTYQMPGLVERAGKLLERRTNRANMIEIWDVAEQCSYTPLHDACVRYMDKIPGSQVVTMLRSSMSSVQSTPRVDSTPRYEP
eukprot:GHVU01129286.1.p1 GENE.GHVU01129286.1~~GHVU01129286.1.p1  ORF type:complete len:482 (-),score=97.36 GHVU01129286.1:304-1749(-)